MKVSAQASRHGNLKFLEECLAHNLKKFALVTALITTSPAAFAGKKVVAVDGDVVLALGGADTADAEAETAAPITFATTLRAGYQLSFVVVDVSLEGGVRSMKFSPDDPLIAIYGGRVNVGKLIKPGVYAHGLVTFDGNSGWEAGLTGDFTALPILKLGLQAGYGELNGRDWFNAGAHLAAQF
jgi:hypothetical protein